MGHCVNCGGALRSEWKFCIYCGTAVARSNEGPRLDIPSAIRPESEGTSPKRRVDIPMIIGILLGVAGLALVVYMAIVLSGPV